eukprot:798678-Pleurochrysis_carterae.AAC.1
MAAVAPSALGVSVNVLRATAAAVATMLGPHAAAKICHDGHDVRITRDALVLLEAIDAQPFAYGLLLE